MEETNSPWSKLQKFASDDDPKGF